MEKYTDEWILKKLRSADQREKDEGLKNVYVQHFPQINKFVQKHRGTDADAADIFQDAVIVFYEKIRLGQLQLNCSIQTYLYSICKNLWFNRLRSQKKLVRMSDEIDEIPIDPKALGILIASERSDFIAKLMEKLGPACKEILNLYYFERLRMKAIAKTLGLANEQGAKNKKSRCLKKLRELLDQSSFYKNRLH